MGSRTMLSSNGGRTSQFQQLPRQNSLYNLTLDEVQNQLQDAGKPLSSMNMDELLRNIWTAEESQAMSAAIGGGGVASANGMSTASGSASAGGAGLQRQGSLTLPRTLSRKTVDEVWRDIQQNQTQQAKGSEEKKPQQRQPTFGEMTLEDFLVKAGVVREDNAVAGNVNTNTNAVAANMVAESSAQAVPVCGVPATMDHMTQNLQAEWLQYQFNTQQQQQQQNMMVAYGAKRVMPQNAPLAIPGNPLLEGGYADNQLGLSSPLMGTSSDSQTPGRKRGPPESIMEKTVERRQKRMIKNRESAARSRARKQAYTNELENEVMQLKEENERLKKQQFLEKLLPSIPPPQPKHTLRRTNSASF
uniref:BZIP domain-containing protein n=1 Tax=Araucaria cunninghamii TaxID=56994 RepID=A0A0D6QWG1_ARACU